MGQNIVYIAVFLVLIVVAALLIIAPSMSGLQKGGDDSEFIKGVSLNQLWTGIPFKEPVDCLFIGTSHNTRRAGTIALADFLSRLIETREATVFTAVRNEVPVIEKMVENFPQSPLIKLVDCNISDQVVADLRQDAIESIVLDFRFYGASGLSQNDQRYLDEVILPFFVRHGFTSIKPYAKLLQPQRWPPGIKCNKSLVKKYLSHHISRMANMFEGTLAALGSEPQNLARIIDMLEQIIVLCSLLTDASFLSQLTDEPDILKVYVVGHDQCSNVLHFLEDMFSIETNLP
jgi:hypothetical protein